MKRNSSARTVALGGVMAALAVVLMCLGGLIPVATYVCPMLCTLLLFVVQRICGSRIGWAWYGAVTILCVLLGPDKEASAVFAAIGYYPLLKPRMDRMKLPWLWKALLFNCAIGAVYTVLIHLLGMAQLVQEFEELGNVMLIVLLVLGNLTFYLLDLLLGRLERKFK